MNIRGRDPKRALILKLRRTVKVMTRFDVRPGVVDLCEEQTCCECGYTEQIFLNTTPEMAKKMIAYRAKGGITGVCPRCSKKSAEERYPFPGEK